MADIILKLYLILALTSSELLSKQMKNLINTSKITQHVIAFIAVLILVDWKYKYDNFVNSVIYSIIIYVLFVLSTKMDLHLNLLVLMLLGFLYYNERQSNSKIMSLEFDKILDASERDKVISILSNNRIYLIVIGIIGIIIGTGLYFRKKEVQYGGNFSLKKFLVD
jgi:hypothetical protein